MYDELEAVFTLLCMVAVGDVKRGGVRAIGRHGFGAVRSGTLELREERAGLHASCARLIYMLQVSMYAEITSPR